MEKIIFSILICLFLAPLDLSAQVSENPGSSPEVSVRTAKKKKKKIKKKKRDKIIVSKEAEQVFKEALETKSEAKYLKAIKMQPDNVRYRCAYVTFLKHENMDRNSVQINCKMYKQYKKVRSLGGGKCQAAASRFIEEFQSTCERS